MLGNMMWFLMGCNVGFCLGIVAVVLLQASREIHEELDDGFWDD